MALAQSPERILDLHAKHPATVKEKGLPRLAAQAFGKAGRTIGRAKSPVNVLKSAANVLGAQWPEHFPRPFHHRQPWTGLTVVTGLDPHSRVLANDYERAVAKFVNLSLSAIEGRMEDWT